MSRALAGALATSTKERTVRWILMILTIAIVGGIIAIPNEGRAAEFVIYSVYRGLDLGNAGETPQKDYFVNIGTAQGVQPGTTLEVSRRMATYDVMSEKLYKDITFPIARLKVIHSEGNAAVARLDKMMPTDKMVSISPTAVMVGDLVKPAN